MKALIKIRCDQKMQFYDGGRIFSQPPKIWSVWYHWRAGQYGRAQGQVGVGGGGAARTEQLRAQLQLERGHAGVIQTK